VGTNTYNHSFFIKLNKKAHEKCHTLFGKSCCYSTFQFPPLVGHEPRVCPCCDDLAAGILFCERPLLRVDHYSEVLCWYSRRWRQVALLYSKACLRQSLCQVTPPQQQSITPRTSSSILGSHGVMPCYHSWVVLRMRDRYLLVIKLGMYSLTGDQNCQKNQFW
jgi:hypothetical protein